MIFIKSVFLSFTIWVLTALLNTMLSGGCLAFSNEVRYWQETFLLVFIGTLIFSIPGIFIFWIVLLVNWRKDLLFRSLLKAGFVISALSSLLLFILPFNHIKGQQAPISLCMIIAAVASIMIHYPAIRSISTNKII
jgi:hypothetical protein